MKPHIVLETGLFLQASAQRHPARHVHPGIPGAPAEPGHRGGAPAAQPGAISGKGAFWDGLEVVQRAQLKVMGNSVLLHLFLRRGINTLICAVTVFRVFGSKASVEVPVWHMCALCSACAGVGAEAALYALL